MHHRSRVLVVSCSLAFTFASVSAIRAQSSHFCDGFEDLAWSNRWTVYQGSQTLVSAPVHSGDSALEFHGGCHSSVYRNGFAAVYGEYTVWANQEHNIAHFSVYTQFATGSDPDPSPIKHTGYEFSLSAANSSGELMYLNRNWNGTQTRLGTGIGQFVLGEWIKVFVRRLPNDTIIAGYERTAGLPARDSIICYDPDPINDPGTFLLWACSDVPPFTYFDDACFEEYNSNPFCEGFEDGTGWENRWERIYGTQTLVSSPAHSGNGALQFRGIGEASFECHSVLRRRDLLAGSGRYSFWINQQHFEAGLWVNIQVQDDPDRSPAFRPGYQLQMHANDAFPPGSFTLLRNDGLGGSQVLLSEPAQFSMSEWVQVWIEHVGNVIIVGYNYNGNVVTYAAIDPSPITTPGGFYISSCSDVTPTDNFYNDICYEPYPNPVIACPSTYPCAVSAEDVNGSGAAEILDVVQVVGAAFRNQPATPNACDLRSAP